MTADRLTFATDDCDRRLRFLFTDAAELEVDMIEADGTGKRATLESHEVADLMNYLADTSTMGEDDAIAMIAILIERALYEASVLSQRCENVSEKVKAIVRANASGDDR